MVTWLNSLLSDGVNGTVSSKRVLTFCAFALCATSFLVELFFGKSVSDHTFESMMYIVIAGLGFTASEKFTSKKE